jgi:hypothetical protein
MSWWLVALVVLGALALSSIGGWPLTVAVLRMAARSSDAGTGDVSPDDGGGDGPTGQRPRAVLGGSAWIGLLERTAITGVLLLGYPSAVAFVVAVKGLGRYPELREHPGSSEQFVIGTLASMLWAGAIGVLGRALLGGDAVV